MQQSTDMIKENMHALGDVDNMSQKELDKMLRNLLISKLGLTNKSKKKPKKSKARFKVVQPSSESESDSSD
jgi:hypothetical protein